jgi:hypothetical protein
MNDRYSDGDRRDPAEALVRFVKDHPVAAVAGAVAIGAVVSALLPRRAGRKLAGRAAQLIEIASVAGLAFGRDAMERAESAGTGLRRQGEALADRAGTLGSNAAERVGRLGGAAAERIEHLVAPAGRAAASAGSRISDRAAGLRKRIKR